MDIWEEVIAEVRAALHEAEGAVIHASDEQVQDLIDIGSQIKGIAIVERDKRKAAAS